MISRKITGDHQDELGNRAAIAFHAGFVIGLIELPELVDLRLAIKICQNLVEAFEGERVRRQFVAAQFKIKSRRRTSGQGKRNEPGKCGAGIRQGMLLVILAQSIHGRALQRKHSPP